MQLLLPVSTPGSYFLFADTVNFVFRGAGKLGGLNYNSYNVDVFAWHASWGWMVRYLGIPSNT